MRMFFLVAVFAGLATSAYAAECGSKGSAAILKITEWDAAKGLYGAAVGIAYENVASKGVTTIDATAWFYDGLGTSIGGIGLNKDPSLPPNMATREEFQMAGFERLYEASKPNLEAIICVQAVIYDDGTKEEF